MTWLENPNEDASAWPVYVTGHGEDVWSVRLGATVLLLTRDADEAYRVGRQAADRDDAVARPLMLLSGPSCQTFSRDLPGDVTAVQALEGPTRPPAQ